MIKFIASVYEHSPGYFRSTYYCVGPDDTYCRAVNLTVLSLITELDQELLDEVGYLLDTMEDPGREPSGTGWANWGYNVVAIWLDPPVAKPGFACFTNDIYPELDVGGEPPQFSHAQLSTILNHWRYFLAEIAVHGMQAMSGRRLETSFNDDHDFPNKSCRAAP
ncbi:hypothetical protein [uncultured Stenotrophomonas sp.]|uniref:hypothetical protein n=1 Tax=uncultured Stenotrophomonas sp. TaxID=165438 RepID=UPI0028E8E98D|nr:hypothetical protein [uncultured Stenotrophomonas sp.]